MGSICLHFDKTIRIKAEKHDPKLLYYYLMFIECFDEFLLIKDINCNNM